MEVRKFLHSASYRLGERVFNVSDIPEYDTRLRQLGALVESPADLGNIRATSDVYTLAQQSIAETLESAAIPPDAIDRVVVCSSHFADRFSHRNRRLSAALVSSRLKPKNLIGICGAGCADLLRGIESACNALDLSAAENVLVIGLDALPDGEPHARIRDYSLISDAAVSFIVGRSAGESSLSRPYRVIGHESTTELSKIGSPMVVSDAKDYARSGATLLERAGLRREDVRKLFGNNIFRSLKKARESAAGFTDAQMYLENVERTGHCLACDTIINLVDFGGNNDCAHYLLLAEAEGHSGALLLTGIETFA